MKKIMLLTQEEMLSSKEKVIYKYQFVINFVAKTKEEIMNFIESQLQMISNCREFIIDKLIPLLRDRS